MKISSVRAIGIGFLGCLLLSATSNPATSQQPATVTSGSISGTVTDAASQPLQGAIVSLAELRLQSITGADGTFSFSSVPAGEYTLVVRRLGYASAVRSHVSSQTAGASVTLVASPMTVDPITVTATRTPAVVGGSVLPISEIGEEGLRRNATISLAHSLKLSLIHISEPTRRTP